MTNISRSKAAKGTATKNAATERAAVKGTTTRSAPSKSAVSKSAVSKSAAAKGAAAKGEVTKSAVAKGAAVKSVPTKGGTNQFETRAEVGSAEPMCEDFPEIIAALVGSIDSTRAALHAFAAYKIGLRMLIMRTNPGHPYSEMSEVLEVLYDAIGDIVRHGDDGGGSHANRFIQDLLRAADRYVKRRKPTRREIIIGAIVAPMYVTLEGGKSRCFPNYKGIAEAILWGNLSREVFLQRVSEQREEFAEPVRALAKRFANELSVYYTEGRLRPGVEADDVARHAVKLAGINVFNALDSAERMRLSRARRRS